jgi:integrase
MPRPRSSTPTYSLTQRGGIWYVQWWQDGAAKRTSCRTADYGEAKVFREALISALGTPLPPTSPTIGAILDGYEKAKAAKVHSSAITYARKSLERHLMDVPASSLTAQRVAGYAAARRKEGAQGASVAHRKKVRPLSDGTIRRELGVLRAALNWARDANWIADAPAVDLPPAQPARDRWLTKREASALLAAADTLHIRTFIALALFTAGRAGAILDLTWNRVDEDAELITLADGKVRGKKRRQTVPIADDLKPYLTEARKGATSPYVVEWRSGRVASVKKGFGAAVAAAKLQGVTPHVLRHTAATWMVQAGVPIKMVADYLGDSVQMIERHYAKHSPDWLRPGAAALSLPRQMAEETKKT